MIFSRAQKVDFLKLLFAGRRDRAERIREQAAKGRRPLHDAERIENEHLPIIAAILADYDPEAAKCLD